MGQPNTDRPKTPLQVCISALGQSMLSASPGPSIGLDVVDPIGKWLTASAREPSSPGYRSPLYCLLAE